MATTTALVFSAAPNSSSPVNLLFTTDSVVIPDNLYSISDSIAPPELTCAINCTPVAQSYLVGVLSQPDLVATVSLGSGPPATMSGVLPDAILTATVSLKNVTLLTTVGVMPDALLTATINVKNVFVGSVEGVIPQPELIGALSYKTISQAAVVGVIPQPALVGVIAIGTVSQFEVAGVIPQPVLQGPIKLVNNAPLEMRGVIPEALLVGAVSLVAGPTYTVTGVLPDPVLQGPVSFKTISQVRVAAVVPQPVLQVTLGLIPGPTVVIAGVIGQPELTALVTVFNQAGDYKSSPDLVFSLIANEGTPVRLLFGEVAPPKVRPDTINYEMLDVLPHPELVGQINIPRWYDVSVAGVLPDAELSATIPLLTISIFGVAGVMPDPELIGKLNPVYLSNTQRPTVGRVGTPWQKAAVSEVGVRVSFQPTVKLPKMSESKWTRGDKTSTVSRVSTKNGDKTPILHKTSHQNGMAVPLPSKLLHADALRSMRQTLNTAFQKAASLPNMSLKSSSQNGIRNISSVNHSPWKKAVPLVPTGYSGSVANGLPLKKMWAERHQNGMTPLVGRYAPPEVIVVKEVCYLPSANLVFWQLPGKSLVFFCEKHAEYTPPAVEETIIPVQKVYLVINSLSLKRVDNNTPIPVKSVSISSDRDTWSWGFNAVCDVKARETVNPLTGPVEVELEINGMIWRFIVENMSESESFGETSISVSGRSVTALLDDPYVLGHSSVQTSLFQSKPFIESILSRPDVPAGFTVDWLLGNTNPLLGWDMPAGTISYEDQTPMQVIKSLIDGVKGVVVSHPFRKQLVVRSRYPYLPWELASQTPNVTLPTSVLRTKSVSLVKSPEYNGVYVSGESTGVSRFVKRSGTAGETQPQVYTNAAISHDDAAREAGRAILSACGTRSMVGLQLPLLKESGLMAPGTLLQVVDGGLHNSESWRGWVHSLSIAASWSGGLNITQNLEVERRVL